MREDDVLIDIDEDRPKSLTMTQTWRKAASYTFTRENKWPLMLSFGLTLLSVAATLIVPMMTSRIVTGLSDDESNLPVTDIILLVGLMIANQVISSLRGTANTHVLKHTQNAVLKDVDHTMLNKWSLSRHLSTSSGDKGFMINKAFSISASVDSLISQIIPNTLQLTAAAAAFSQQYNAAAGLQVGFMLLATLTCSHRSSKKIMRAEEDVMTKGADAYRELLHNATSYKAIHDSKQATLRHRIAAKTNAKAAKVYANSQVTQQDSGRRYIAIASAFTLSMLLTNRSALNSSQALVAMVTYLSQLTNSLPPFGRAIDSVFGAYPNLNFIMSQLARPSEIIDDCPDSIIPGREHGLAIRFNHVTFGYDDKQVLNGITFDVMPGQWVALVSKSGGGKSTIFNCLYRYFQAQGDISINGKNINEIGLDHLRDHITVIGQEPLLFSGSVRDNIGSGSKNPDSVTEDQITAIAERLGLLEVIHDIGLDKDVGENGSKLSGGQRQKVAIIRAFLEPKLIILMDEITAALDAGSAQRVLRGIKEHYHDSTVMIITHKLKEAQDYCDNIAVIDDGKVIAQAPHDDLIQVAGGCELYQTLYHSQQTNTADTESKAPTP